MLDVLLDARAGLEWYTAAALKTMLRCRTDTWKDARGKGECLDLLRRSLYDPESIARALASADALAREALALLRRKGGVMPVAAMRGQLATWHPELRPDEVERLPGELVRRALAFWHVATPRYSGAMHDVQRPAADNPHAALIFSPPEILDHVPIPPDLGYLPLVPSGPAEIDASPGQAPRRVLAFLRAVEDRPLRVLRSGAIGARERAALAQALGLGTDESGRSREEAASASRLVSFLRAILGKAGLLEVSGDLVLRTTARALPFVARSPVQQAQELLAAWLAGGDNEFASLGHLRLDRRASSPSVVPDDHRVREAYRTLVEALRHQARPGFWYDVADLSRVIRYQDVEFLVSWRDPTPYSWALYSFGREQVAAPSYAGITLEDSRGRSRALTMGIDWDLVEGAFIRAVVQGPLTWLGLLESQTGSRGAEMFALTPLGAQVLDVAGAPAQLAVAALPDHADALIVQPNFEVVVYEPEARAELLYQIDRFAERVTVDRLAIYRLSRESLAKGLQLGLRIDDVISLLETAARAPLPQNVAYTLCDWARQFEAVRWIRNASLLEAPDPATLDRWLATSRLGGLVERRVAPTVALLTGAAPGDVSDVLRHLGADVRIVDANEPLTPCARVVGATTLRLDVAAANLFVRSALEEIADPVGESPPSGYEITRESVRRALDRGLTAERILETLRRVIVGELPSHLRLRVRGWSDAIPPVEIGPVALLVAPDPETLRDVRSDPAFSPDLITTISATAALVRLEAVDRLRAELTSRGIRTRPYVPPAPAPSAKDERPGPTGLVELSPNQVRQTLERALARGERVLLEYREEADGRLARYLVEPRALHQRAGSFVLLGYCLGDDASREFRLANVVAVGRCPIERGEVSGER